MLNLPVTKKRVRLPAHPVDREAQVAQLAYQLAEKRGFEPGGELDDWIRAENIVDAGEQRGAKG